MLGRWWPRSAVTPDQRLSRWTTKRYYSWKHASELISACKKTRLGHSINQVLISTSLLEGCDVGRGSSGIEDSPIRSQLGTLGREGLGESGNHKISRAMVMIPYVTEGAPNMVKDPGAGRVCKGSFPVGVPDPYRACAVDDRPRGRRRHRDCCQLTLGNFSWQHSQRRRRHRNRFRLARFQEPEHRISPGIYCTCRKEGIGKRRQIS